MKANKPRFLKREAVIGSIFNTNSAVYCGDGREWLYRENICGNLMNFHCGRRIYNMSYD